MDRRRVHDPPMAAALTAVARSWRVDLGCAPRSATSFPGELHVSLDASHARLRRTSGARVQADLESLPFRREALDGARGSTCDEQVPHESLPLVLAELHRSLALDAPVSLRVAAGRGSPTTDADRLRATVEGAGFTVERVTANDHHLEVQATRARMLPDLVRPGLRALICGYNPSLYAADRGVAFARPGNRFWPAALEAQLVTRDRDPWHAVRRDGVGFTDLVKRATVAAAELTTDELRAGLARVTALCEWLAPEVICFLGVGGWRRLVDRKAVVGWQDVVLGPTRVYVMPNPSGLNASTKHEGYVAHFRELGR